MSQTPETDDVIAKIASMSLPDQIAQLSAHGRVLERQRQSLAQQLDKSEAYIRKMDGILEEVGGVTVSCINPYEDIKRSLLSLKAIRDGKRHALRQ